MKQTLVSNIDHSSRTWFDRVDTARFALLGDLKGKKILDLCGGNGFMSVRFSDKGAKVTIMDIESQLMKNFRIQPQSHGIDIVIGDSESLPFRDGIFDMVYGGGALHHLPHLEQGIKEVHRILKKDGKLYAEDPNLLNLPAFIARKLFYRRGYDPNQRQLTTFELKKVISTYFRNYSIRTYYPFFSYLVSYLTGDVKTFEGSDINLMLPRSLKNFLDVVDQIFEKLPLFESTGAIITTYAIKEDGSP